MIIHGFELRVRNAANQVTTDVDIEVIAPTSSEAKHDMARGIEWAV